MRSVLKTRSIAGSMKATVVGFGGGAISGGDGGYSFGEMAEAQAVNLLQYAYEKGITLFDTAPIYGFSTSERRIGLALAGHKGVRDQITLVSKLGVTWDNNRSVRVDNSPSVTRRMLETSLRNLQTDYLDIYMIHWPDPHTPVEDTMQELVRAREEGLIRAIGACNFTPELIERAERVAPLDVLQSPFSLLQSEARDVLFPVLRSRNKGFMSYGTLAKGILGGSVKKGRSFDKSDFRARGDRFMKQYEAVEVHVNEFERVAMNLGLTPSQLAGAWVLSHPEVSTALCGTKTAIQIDEIVALASLEIPSDAKAALDLIASKATPVFAAS